jgi:N-acetylmuramoyl-L-alanine amidase
MQIHWAPSPNYTGGRRGRKIIAIVNHITAGLMPGTLSWLRNPAAKASAHYLVTKSGVVYQLVKDEDTAWHAGIVNKPSWPLYDGSNPNYYTLGIEHETLAGESLTEVQYWATLELHRMLVKKHGIPSDRNHIIGHYRLDSVNRKNDPGPGFPWNRLFNDLARLNTVDSSPQIIIDTGNNTINGFLHEDRAYGPVREIATALGWQVEWLNEARTAVLLPPPGKDDSKANAARVVIARHSLTVTILGDRAFAPVRQLAESMGYKVDWDGENKTVKIT